MLCTLTPGPHLLLKQPRSLGQLRNGQSELEHAEVADGHKLLEAGETITTEVE